MTPEKQEHDTSKRAAAAFQKLSNIIGRGKRP